jgi:hypothetical protein
MVAGMLRGRRSVNALPVWNLIKRITGGKVAERLMMMTREHRRAMVVASMRKRILREGIACEVVICSVQCGKHPLHVDLKWMRMIYMKIPMTVVKVVVTFDNTRKKVLMTARSVCWKRKWLAWPRRLQHPRPRTGETIMLIGLIVRIQPIAVLLLGLNEIMLRIQVTKAREAILCAVKGHVLAELLNGPLLARRVLAGQGRGREVALIMPSR